ncbi:MAG: twin-arginine translocase subunit TatC [Candidatus Omnitrophota bacterium]|nr:MAG: twin-arginine translocase subunit TatC [Candidatus Omnitrophota bacterium]
MQDRRLTFFQHLEEVRNRVIKCIVFLVIVACLIYQLIPSILPFLVRPVGSLVFIHPTEAFITKLSIAFWGGLLFSSPFFLYQIWQFISSGLKEKEKKYAFIFGVWSLVSFIGGSAFGYFLVFPAGLKFLINFSDEFIRPMITVSKYISFLGGLTLIFGVIFQFPLVVLFLVKIGLVNPAGLVKLRRQVIVGLFIMAAFLTPPDVVTQILLAVPLLILYEVSVLIAKIIYKRC